MDLYNELKKPLVKSFSITGLHGYKNVEVSFDGPVRVVIAENGTGKTTILNALYSFLKGKKSRLAAINFRTISCTFWDGNTVSIDKSQISQFDESILPARLIEAIKGAGVSPRDLYEIAIPIYREQGLSVAMEHPLVRRVYTSSPLSSSGMEDLLQRMMNASQEQGSLFEDGSIFDTVRRYVGDYEIDYLPTYRRIELPLGGESRTPKQRYSSALREGILEVPYGGTESDMNFGLFDVQERLNQLADDVGRRSNIGYRELSAVILDELLANKNAESIRGAATAMPDIDSLNLFFSRISRGDQLQSRLQRLSELYETKEILSNENATIRYFLERLYPVVESTREIEQALQNFVNAANSFLQMSSDEKEVTYDPRTAKVRVRDVTVGVEIPLNDLSSGEKQVISLFARLYLHTQKRFMLIDEPELSLSIKWQQMLLPRVVQAPACEQVFAITHSPFIFDNELDRYAAPLIVSRG